MLPWQVAELRYTNSGWVPFEEFYLTKHAENPWALGSTRRDFQKREGDIMSFRSKVLDPSCLLLGSFLGISSPALVEMLGHAGYDFVILDAEHGTFSAERMEDCLRASTSVNVPCLVRIGALDSMLIQGALDIGADGVQIPQVETASQARAAVQYCQFPPDGTRGYGSTTRAAGYGFRSRSSVKELAQNDLVVSIQIESREGVENLTALLETKRVDVVFIGTSDLSMSYGCSTPNDPSLIPIIEKLVSNILAAGKVPGIHVTDLEKIGYLRQLGIRYFTVSASALIWDALTRQAKDFQSIKRGT